jgi:hypothetical protein
MDLNRPPTELPLSFSLGDIRFVTRAKSATRDALVRRFGETGYNAILASTEPFIFVTFHQGKIVIFILT